MLSETNVTSSSGSTEQEMSPPSSYFPSSSPQISLSNNLSFSVLYFGGTANTSSIYGSGSGGTGLVPMTIESSSAASEDMMWVPTYSNDLQVLVILIAYTISFLLSFGGNCLAVIVFVRYDNWPKDLRLLLTNICVASLLSAVVCLPFTLLYQLLQSWVFARHLCRIVTFLQLAATIGTILTHLAIGLNRLWVIVYPLKASTFQEYVWRIVGIVWLLAAAISAPNFITSDTKARREDDACYAGKLYLMCTEQWDPEYLQAAYTWALMICMYFLPMIVLLCIYGIAGYYLSKSEEIILNERTIAKRLETKRKVLRMLMLIFALFALSWLPLHIFFIFQSFHEELIMANFEMAERIYWIIHWMATSNSFQNPIVYCFFDEKFKVGVVHLFGGKKGRPGSGPTSKGFSTSTVYSRGIMSNYSNDAKQNKTTIRSLPPELKSAPGRQNEPQYKLSASCQNNRYVIDDAKSPLFESNKAIVPLSDGVTDLAPEPAKNAGPNNNNNSKNGSLVKDAPSASICHSVEEKPLLDENNESKEKMIAGNNQPSEDQNFLLGLPRVASPTSSSVSTLTGPAGSGPNVSADGTSASFFVLYEYSSI